ncbi:MAG: hypothetical protein ACI85F_000642 [Bacteroidia bacterium]
MPGYTFLWDDPFGQTNSTATGLSPGLYAVTATDAAGCSFTTQITQLIEPDSLFINVASITDLTCNEGQDGLATLTSVGGSMPYSYQWNDS